MPWKYGKYKFGCKVNENGYDTYKMTFKSKQGNGFVDLKSSGAEMKNHQGFISLDEQIHILTHPVIGYYNHNENEFGTYEIWHPKIELKEAIVKRV
jgi:hypothetical protein